MRTIPSTMATQHPDNASSPFWETDGDGLVNVHEELDEMMVCFKDLRVEEFMWDFEGKYADEAVIDKLFAKYFDYFKKHTLGKDQFLTFRLPNVWEEKGYSLARGLMVILTSEDFAKDLGFHSPPLFEIILPMTEKAEQMIYVQNAFQELSKAKQRAFPREKRKNNTYLDIIPLVESVQSQIHIKKILTDYIALHKKQFGTHPSYIRPFLAGSDPALVSGFIPSILGSKIALSEIASFSKENNTPTFPMIGVGSLLFRGGLNPDSVKEFTEQYAGVKTVTIQSAFRYDYPLEKTKSAISYLKKQLPKTHAQPIPEADKKVLEKISQLSTKIYRNTLAQILPDVEPMFALIPKRRERRLHIGLLAYKRNIEQLHLPRAITFTGGFYSLGIPPELLATGRTLAALNEKELDILCTYYAHIKKDLAFVGQYLNRENLDLLMQKNPAWKNIATDCKEIETFIGKSIGPKTREHTIHAHLTSSIFLLQNHPEEAAPFVLKAAKIRKSLG